MSKKIVWWLTATLVLSLAFIGLFSTALWQPAQASYGGRISFSGNPQTNGGSTCTACHTAGATLPTVSISGPATVNAGQTYTYTVNITGGPAQTAGFNVSTSDHVGELTPIDSDVQRIVNELTHTQPQVFAGGSASFTYSWTAPTSNQLVTMYAAGNSSNGQSDLAGDGINTTTLSITVQNGVPPTPTPTPPPPVDVITLTLVANTLAEPVGLTHAGDERLFIVEKPGEIRVVDENGTLLPTSFLEITGRVDDSASEMGLLGLAFHPNYASNGYFYVNYTVGSPRRTRISRFTVTSNPNVADENSELIIMEFSQPDWNHNGGDLAFGPDGYLYIASGDGGGSGDTSNNSQNLTRLLGKILRIDVDLGDGDGPDCNTAAGFHYTIPPDNAFTDGDGGNCDEIWAIGARNPWRFSFDRLTGDFWIADVGQGQREEVNYLPAGSLSGLNLGWRCYEGNLPFNTAGCGPISDYTFPVHEYSHGGGRCSITGGYVYRGIAYPSLWGQYFFADYCSQDIWTLSGSPADPTVTDISLAPGSYIYTVSSFGEDVNGELYIVNKDEGSVWQIVGPITAGVDSSLAEVETGEGAESSSYTLVLTAPPTGGVTINLNHSGQVSLNSSTLEFNDENWNIPKTVTVTAVDDSLVEGNHWTTITYTVESSDPAYNNLTVDPLTVYLTDNDLSYSWAEVELSAVEGQTGTQEIELTIHRTGAITSEVSMVEVELGGTAAEGDDYTTSLGSGLVNFPAGVASQTVTVEVIGDTLDELNETVVFTLTNPTASGTAEIGEGVATLTILDDDGEPLVSFSEAAVEVVESVEEVVITVILSNSYSDTITVHVGSSDGSATAGEDYTPISQTLTFDPGTTSLTVTVAITDEGAVEPTETFSLTLASPTNAVLGLHPTIQVAIVNDYGWRLFLPQIWQSSAIFLQRPGH